MQLLIFVWAVSTDTTLSKRRSHPRQLKHNTIIKKYCQAFFSNFWNFFRLFLFFSFLLFFMLFYTKNTPFCPLSSAINSKLTLHSVDFLLIFSLNYIPRSKNAEIRTLQGDAKELTTVSDWATTQKCDVYTRFNIIICRARAKTCPIFYKRILFLKKACIFFAAVIQCIRRTNDEYRLCIRRINDGLEKKW